VTGTLAARNRFLHQAAQNGFNWWVLVVAFVPGLMSSVVFDRGRLGGSVWEWFSIGLAVYLATVLMFTTVRLIKERFSPNAGWIYTFGSYLLIGWGRGVVSFYLTTQIGLAPQSDLLYRLMGSPIFSVVTFITATAIVDGVLRQRQARNQLFSERDTLQLAIANFKSQKERLQAELIGRVTGVLAPVLKDLNQKLAKVKDPGSAKVAVASLQDTVDRVVRPLSHTLAFDFSNLTLTQETGISPLKRSILPSRVSFSLLPGWGALLVLATTVAPASVDRQITDALTVVGVASVLLYSILRLLDLLLGRIRTNPLFAGILEIGSYLLAGTLVTAIIQASPWSMNGRDSVSFALLCTVVGVVTYVTSLANEVRDTSLAEIASVNEAMQLVRSQLRQQVWLEQRRVAQVLHGSVQGALYASAIRLARENAPDAKVIEEVKTDIENSLAELSSQHNPDFSFSQVLDSIFDLWRDSVEFDLQLDDLAVSWLENDNDSAECVIEVVREAVNNAMRHAKAKNISVSIVPQRHGLVLVTVINDGTPLKSAVTAGYGSSMMNDITHRWSLESLGDRTALTALVAVKPS
jgi:signal transduction histidine kinase